MTRREEIRQAANDYLQSEGLQCNFTEDNFAAGVFEGIIAGAEWADAHQPSPWISVEDRLPEIQTWGESRMVFVHVINRYTGEEWIEIPAKYNIHIQDWICDDFTHIGKRYGVVTHWMPIPELKTIK